MMNIKIPFPHPLLGFILIVLSIISCKQTAAPSEEVVSEVYVEQEDSIDNETEYPGWKQFPENDLYHLDIRYATENNFVKEKMYDCGACFLRDEAGEALEKVAISLAQINYKLVLFDCYRPKPIQQKLWDKVPDPRYVARPSKGSMHNRGAAVDLSIIDDKGNYLDMGTPYDFFGEEAHTDFFDLPKHVLKNRKLLDDLMEKYGFKGIRTEWWHFSYQGDSYEIADWVWECED